MSSAELSNVGFSDWGFNRASHRPLCRSWMPLFFLYVSDVIIFNKLYYLHSLNASLVTMYGISILLAKSEQYLTENYNLPKY